MCCKTWLSTEGLPNVLHTMSGALAGSAYADLMFLSNFGTALAGIHSELVMKNLLFGFDVSGLNDFFGVDVANASFMDAIAVAFLT